MRETFLIKNNVGIPLEAKVLCPDGRIHKACFLTVIGRRILCNVQKSHKMIRGEIVEKDGVLCFNPFGVNAKVMG